MRSIRLIVGGALAVAAVAVPLSSASARCGWRYHGCYGGPVVGAAGAVVEGALTVATLPIALAADIVSAPFEAAAGPAPAYYGGQPYYSGPAYGPAYGPSYAYYGPRPSYGPRYWHRRYRRAYCCSYGY